MDVDTPARRSTVAPQDRERSREEYFMKPNNGHGAVRALGGRIAAVLLGVVCGPVRERHPGAGCRVEHH